MRVTFNHQAIYTKFKIIFKTNFAKAWNLETNLQSEDIPTQSKVKHNEE